VPAAGVPRPALRWPPGKGSPGVTYLHPWEIDDFRPATRQSALLRLRSQGGQHTMLAKLENLMRQGHFTTLGEHR